MLPRPRGIFFSSITRAAWLAGILLLLLPVDLLADQMRSNVVCREELSPPHREQLAGKLRRITGLPDLKIDNDGILRAAGNRIAGGSESARELLANAVNGRNVVVLEDASNRADVAFCRVIPGKWQKDAASKPPAFVVQIDFADFDQLVGDERAVEAFNVGWGLLHELDHIVNDSPDAASLHQTGECEAHINQMRRECNLPERADYFSTLSPLSTDPTFTTRLVRLAFEEQKPPTNKKRRYWLTWDATVVGGLDQNQIAALR
ncbi:MAG: hypothetical protein ACREA9_09175 [Pyrinomonadaceae bacterium]